MNINSLQAQPPTEEVPEEVTSPAGCLAAGPEGTPCMAIPMKGTTHCYQHSLTVADERSAARRRGGRARGKQITATAARARGESVPAGEEDMTSAVAIRRLMARTFEDVRAGRLSSKQGQVMVSAARLALDVCLKDQDARLAELEALVEAQRPRGRR
jgi:hypothetical protein